jgi:hypothetical protein
LAAQQWNIVPAADGHATIVNVNSGLCLDDTDGKTAPGSTIQQSTCNCLGVQQWRLINANGGQVNIVNRNSNLCLVDFNLQKSPGSEVRQRLCADAVSLGQPDLACGVEQIRADGVVDAIRVGHRAEILRENTLNFFAAVAVGVRS